MLCVCVVKSLAQTLKMSKPNREEDTCNHAGNDERQDDEFQHPHQDLSREAQVLFVQAGQTGLFPQYCSQTDAWKTDQSEVRGPIRGGRTNQRPGDQSEARGPIRGQETNQESLFLLLDKDSGVITTSRGRYHGRGSCVQSPHQEPLALRQENETTKRIRMSP